MAGSTTSAQELASHSDSDSQNHFRPTLLELSGFFVKAIFIEELLLEEIFVLIKMLFKFFVGLKACIGRSIMFF